MEQFRVNRNLTNRIILPSNKIILRKHSKVYDMAAIEMSTSSSNRCRRCGFVAREE